MKIKSKCRKCGEDKTEAGYLNNYLIECRKCVVTMIKFYQKVLKQG